MRPTSKRERTILIAAVVVIGLLGLDRVLLQPLLDRLKQADTRIAAANEELARAREIRSNDQRAAYRWDQMAGDSLASDGPAADIQVLNHAQQWAREAGLTLTGTRQERNERAEDFQRITIRATGTGDMQQVARFLYLVENAGFPLRVSDVQVTTRREGTDELSLQIGLSTIYLSPDPHGPGLTEARR